jgi:DNA-directed RNA polymerase subunit N (RpoN/RPB10)
MAARIRCIIPRCTCHRKLGVHQAEFEQLLASGMTHNEALIKIDRTWICCRANILYPPTYPVVDANTGVFVDELGISSYAGTGRGKSVIRDGPSFYFENSPGFPVDLPSRTS